MISMFHWSYPYIQQIFLMIVIALSGFCWREALRELLSEYSNFAAHMLVKFYNLQIVSSDFSQLSKPVASLLSHVDQ
jgi:hypothetical protein